MDAINNLGYLIQHTAGTMHRQLDQALQERLGIGMSQFKILMLLQSHANVQQKVLAERLGQTEAAISRQVKLLHERGMLAMTVNPQNRREHLSVPTAKGVKLAIAARDILHTYGESLFAALSPKQQQQLTEALTTLHEQVCAAGKPFACDKPFEP